MIMETIISLVIIFVIFLITSLPLHWAVKFLGGKTYILKTMFINFLAAIVFIIVREIFSTWGGVFAFILVAILYREVFKLRWWKAFLVWLFEAIFLAILILLATLIFGAAFLAGLGIGTLI